MSLMRSLAVLAGVAGIATCGIITACGGSGPMSQAEAQSTYSSIVAPIKSDLAGTVQAAKDNNFSLVRQKALAAKKDIDALPSKLRQYNWPSGTSKWNAPHIHLIQAKAPIMSRCLGAVGQASDLLEMEAAIQGDACQQLQNLG